MHHVRLVSFQTSEIVSCEDYVMLMVDEWNNRTEQKCNDYGRGNQKCSEENQSAENKSHMAWLGIETGPQLGASPSLSTVISPFSSVGITPTSPKRLSPTKVITKLPASTFLWTELLDNWREIVGRWVREGRWGLETDREELSHGTYFPVLCVFIRFLLLRRRWSQNLLKFNKVVRSVSRGQDI